MSASSITPAVRQVYGFSSWAVNASSSSMASRRAIEIVSGFDGE